MQRLIFLMPRENIARGKVLGALPRIPARGTPPETPAPFPFTPIFQNGSSPSRVRGGNLFKNGKHSLRRASTARPGPLRAVPKSPSQKGKGATAKAIPLRFRSPLDCPRSLPE